MIYCRDYKRSYGSRTRTEIELYILRINFENLSLKKSFFEPIPVKIDETLISKFLAEINFNDYSDVYKTEILAKCDIQYENIKALFTRTNKNCFHITNIVKINNPFLLAQYKLKKLEYLERYKNCEEMKLFHGTMLQNIKTICQTNFDWRLRGM